jgi:hypothetical protein
MQRLKSARHAQCFLSAHSRIHNHFQLRRHRLTANEHRAARKTAFRTWREVAGVASAAGEPDQPQALGLAPTINLTTLRALSGSAVEMWGGGVTRDFIHVDDVAAASQGWRWSASRAARPTCPSASWTAG